ncbi:MAG: hypothetical protein MI866_16215 [Bacteroidales bacterium]|nr:hypothetical protein [Bacteroidales bacterium]
MGKNQFVRHIKPRGVFDEFTIFNELNKQLLSTQAKNLVFDMSELSLKGEYAAIYNRSKMFLPLCCLKKKDFIAFVCQTRKTTLLAYLIKLQFDKKGVVCMLFYDHNKAIEWITCINNKE